MFTEMTSAKRFIARMYGGRIRLEMGCVGPTVIRVFQQITHAYLLNKILSLIISVLVVAVAADYTKKLYKRIIYTHGGEGDVFYC